MSFQVGTHYVMINRFTIKYILMIFQNIRDEG